MFSVVADSATATLARLIEITPGLSLSMILIVAVFSGTRRPPVGLLNTMLKLSIGSESVSSTIGTRTCLESLSPSGQVRVPDVAVKSSGSTALPDTVV